MIVGNVARDFDKLQSFFVTACWPVIFRNDLTSIQSQSESVCEATLIDFVSCIFEPGLSQRLAVDTWLTFND